MYHSCEFNIINILTWFERVLKKKFFLVHQKLSCKCKLSDHYQTKRWAVNQATQGQVMLQAIRRWRWLLKSGYIDLPPRLPTRCVSFMRFRQCEIVSESSDWFNNDTNLLNISILFLLLETAAWSDAGASSWLFPPSGFRFATDGPKLVRSWALTWQHAISLSPPNHVRNEIQVNLNHRSVI